MVSSCSICNGRTNGDKEMCYKCSKPIYAARKRDMYREKGRSGDIDSYKLYQQEYYAVNREKILEHKMKIRQQRKAQTVESTE